MNELPGGGRKSGSFSCRNRASALLTAAFMSPALWLWNERRNDRSYNRRYIAVAGKGKWKLGLSLHLGVCRT